MKGHIVICDKCLKEYRCDTYVDRIQYATLSESNGWATGIVGTGIYIPPDTTRHLCMTCFKTVLEFIDNE